MLTTIIVQLPLVTSKKCIATSKYRVQMYSDIVQYITRFLTGLGKLRQPHDTITFVCSENPTKSQNGEAPRSVQRSRAKYPSVQTSCLVNKNIILFEKRSQFLRLWKVIRLTRTTCHLSRHASTFDIYKIHYRNIWMLTVAKKPLRTACKCLFLIGQMTNIWFLFVKVVCFVLIICYLFHFSAGSPRPGVYPGKSRWGRSWRRCDISPEKEREFDSREFITSGTDCVSQWRTLNTPRTGPELEGWQRVSTDDFF